MVFSSYLFIFFFLPLVLVVYYASPKRLKHLVLTVFSYVFYGWANPGFMLLMFYSTVIDYICGLVISKQWGHFKEPIKLLEPDGKRDLSQRISLFISIITNLSLLGFFKYFNFSLENYNLIMNMMGIEGTQIQGFFRVVLPLGISFYTFQSMSYSIDVYRGEAKAIRNFINFACYVSMFPQLVAGPIIRFKEIDDQLINRSHTMEKFVRGIAFFCLGIGKKVLLANPCGKIADFAFDSGTLGVIDSWYGIVAYAFQIYFDFSGYSDMAIGLGLMFGFVFAKNFDSPYISKSITEFWRRWHISLSTWLRDYLYIPLGGNRKGKLRTYLNLTMVMLLGGLWHGASWNFLIWGAIHGAYLAFERIQGKKSFYKNLPGELQTIITFVVVLVAWVFFRADTLAGAWKYLCSMFGCIQIQKSAMLIDGIIYNPYYLSSFGLAAVVVWFFPQTWDFTKNISWPKAFYIIAVFLLAIAALVTQTYNPFIYFIF